MKSQEKNSRRRFIKNSAAVVAGISIIPRHVLGRGFLAPSDQLTKGNHRRRWYGPRAYSLMQEPG